MRAILEVYKVLAEQHKDFELATGLCNQDSVEHLFSKLRQRGGSNPNPTARMVRLSFRHILSTGYIQPSDKGNVQFLQLESLINPSSKIVKTVENYLTANNVTVQYDEHENELHMQDIEIVEECDELENADDINTLNTHNENDITFFAGYVARRSFAKTNCENCCNIMMKTPMDDATGDKKCIENIENI